MKKMAKNIVVSVVFVALMAGILYRVKDVLDLNVQDGGYAMERFYEQPADSVEVLNLGSSHMYTSANPAVLWDLYGIASYNLGASMQPVWNTYYYLQEALKYQHPKVIVMDVFAVSKTADFQESQRVGMNTQGLKVSQTRMENVKVSVANESEDVDYFLGFPIYHTRYDDIRESYFRDDHGDGSGVNYKGFALQCISTTPVGGFTDVASVEDVNSLTDKNREYLERIIALAKQEEIPLLLVVAPYTGITYEDKKYYNAVEQMVQDAGSGDGVAFVDFNEMCEEIGLDPQNDFAEGNHMNYYGSEIYSKFYGAYLMERYDLTDHRGDEKYATWDADSAFYKKKAANVDIWKTEEGAAYLKKVFAQQDRYTIGILLSGDWYQEELPQLAVLEEQGLDIWNKNMFFIQNGEQVYAINCGEEAGDYYDNAYGEAAACDRGMLYLDGIRDFVTDTGINLVIYDNDLGELVDAVGICNDGTIVRTED